MAIDIQNRYLAGDHFLLIFDYLDINTLLLVSRTGSVFQQQLRPRKTARKTATSDRDSTNYDYSPYLATRILHALLAPYIHATSPSFDVFLCLPADFRDAVPDTPFEIVTKTFQNISTLIENLYWTMRSKKCFNADEWCPHTDHVPIPTWSIDKGRELDVLNAEREIRFARALKYEDWAVLLEKQLEDAQKRNEHAWTRPKLPRAVVKPLSTDPISGDDSLTIPHVILPLDAVFIFRYFHIFLCDLVESIEDDALKLHSPFGFLSTDKHSNDRVWQTEFNCRWAGREGYSVGDEGGFWVSNVDGERKFLYPFGISLWYHQITDFLLDCTPAGKSSTYGAIYQCNQSGGQNMEYVIGSMSGFLNNMLEALKEIEEIGGRYRWKRTRKDQIVLNWGWIEVARQPQGVWN